MTAERLFAWAAALVCAAVFWVGYTRGAPTPPEREVAVALGVVVALPLAVVFLGWLSSLRSGTRGWG
ncbi:hypothetical protein [Natronomonas marina]|uniref:hypothetical protein n=1 Tax=Natronomonas marina TaxID=2961939 RepID=UPI0020C9906E|nr:hypothetical protein [Natronomonas marina]